MATYEEDPEMSEIWGVDLTTATDAEVLGLCDAFADKMHAGLRGEAFPGSRPIGDRLHEECRRRGIMRS
jgi:hypothetical protein